MEMNHSDKTDPGIRKVAILVRALDEPLAQNLLDGLGPQTAQLVQETVALLDEVDPKEEEAILVEFFRVGSQSSATLQKRPSRFGRSVAGFSRRERKNKIAPTRPVAPVEEKSSGKAFGFLGNAEAEDLASILSGERPQTIALVLSNLPESRAGAVLTRFPAELQTEVIRRLVDLEEADPEVLREVEESLKNRLVDRVPLRRRRVGGLSAVQGMLKAINDEAGREILENLSRFDRRLVDQLAIKPVQPEIGPLSFDDVARLPREAMATLVAAAGPKLWELALVGASEELVERVLSHFGFVDAEMIRGRLQHLGPIRLSDVELARQKLAEMARAMVLDGRLVLPEGMRHPSLQMMA